MKRFHVHVSVDDLQKNIRFYSTMFGAEPSVVKDDYAKWMLDDPRINFAISQRGREVGLNHLGVQVDSEEELTALRDQLAAADAARTAARAQAQKALTDACSADITKLCGGAAPGSREARQCLFQKRTSLSSSCSTAMASQRRAGGGGGGRRGGGGGTP